MAGRGGRWPRRMSALIARSCYVLSRCLVLSRRLPVTHSCRTGNRSELSPTPASYTVRTFKSFESSDDVRIFHNTHQRSHTPLHTIRQSLCSFYQTKVQYGKLRTPQHELSIKCTKLNTELERNFGRLVIRHFKCKTATRAAAGF